MVIIGDSGMTNQLKDLLEDIKTHLEYQKMMGVTEIPKDVGATLRGRPKMEGTEALPYTKTSKNSEENQKALDEIKKDIGDCKRCKLCKERNKIVFGVGDPCAELMFVGEGPGADEDEQGIPFVGRAGQLLTKIIQAMGMERKDVYIGNIAKCRPPNNRNPEPDEIETCMPFLVQQINVIKPKIIVALGAVAAKAMMQTEVPISKLRGKLLDWPPAPLTRNSQPGTHNCKLIPTYHPAFLLRNPNMKRPVWEDMQKVMKELA